MSPTRSHSLARRRTASKTVLTLRSARRMQSAWRGLQGRRTLQAAVGAAVAVQAAARSQLAVALYARQLRSITRLQSHGRRLQARRDHARPRPDPTPNPTPTPTTQHKP